MTADEVLWLVTELVFGVLFVLVAYRAIRRRRSADIDTALFFAAIVVALIISEVDDVFGIEDHPILEGIQYAAVSALPYVLLRLVDDFSPRARWLMRAAPVALGVLVAAGFLFPPPRPVVVAMAPMVWFVLLGGYATITFARHVRRTTGVTSRRMLAVAIGAGLIWVVLLLAAVRIGVEELDQPLLVAIRFLVMGAGLAFFLGFSPPPMLRRAWQEPELRAFLTRAAKLPRLPDTQSIVQELAQGAAASTGAPAAVIGLWNAERRKLQYRAPDGTLFETDPDEFIGGRAFTSRTAIFSDNAMRDDPEHADAYAGVARAVLAAPILADENALGVLCVYAPRPPIFADDDLRLVQLLADQAAVILESRALIDEAASVRARDAATQLKDDFLSAAAHDLRTPLTALILQAELISRQLEREPESTVKREQMARILGEAERLRTLVADLLDASRADEGQLLGRRVEADLAEIARRACASAKSRHTRCELDAPSPVVGTFDAHRIRQLIDNLIGNAVKYTPDGGVVRVRAWRDGNEARLSVSDEGIGIPSADLPHLFERFHRGSNVDDRRFKGLGLGLYICKAIVTEHGGHIQAHTELGKGTAFDVRMPLSVEGGATGPAADAEIRAPA